MKLQILLTLILVSISQLHSSTQLPPDFYTRPVEGGVSSKDYAELYCLFMKASIIRPEFAELEKKGLAPTLLVRDDENKEILSRVDWLPPSYLINGPWVMTKDDVHDKNTNRKAFLVLLSITSITPPFAHAEVTAYLSTEHSISISLKAKRTRRGWISEDTKNEN